MAGPMPVVEPTMIAILPGSGALADIIGRTRKHRQLEIRLEGEL